MIGNDIVDLTFAQRQHLWLERKGLHKVFTQEEQDFIHAHSDPELACWMLWAAKESTYKACLQQLGKRSFIPRRIVCQVADWKEEYQTMQVQVNEYRSWVSFTQTTTFVHAVAQPLPYYESVANKEYEVPEVHLVPFASSDYQVQQQQIREAVKYYFQSIYQDTALEVKLCKNNLDIPSVYVAGRAVSVGFSCSHHGHYGAWVLAKKQAFESAAI